MTQLSVLWTYVQLQATRLRQDRDERGAITHEQIILVVVLVVIVYSLVVIQGLEQHRLPS